MNLTTTIRSIQDIMRQDVGVDGDAQRIGQLVWLLFLKIFDDREQEIEAFDRAYVSPIPPGLRWRDWAQNREGITGDGLLEFINGELFPTLKQLAPVNEREMVVHAVFSDVYNYMKSGTLLRQVVNKVSEMDFNRSQDRHLFNDVYEKVLSDLQGAGHAGEYYTPRAVTQFMIEMLNPRLGERLLDPACGTGGFLVSAIEHIRRADVHTPADVAALQTAIFGIEKKPLPHLLCVTNLILHGIDVPSNVRHDNTLTRPYSDYSERDRVDVIATNPPFGGMEEYGIEQNFPSEFRTRETADLFLVLLMHILKDGGRAAVVLPDGTLFGEGIKTRIKERLLQTCDLHTIVRLPNGVFSPYTNIKTNLLFLQKGRPTSEIWYYEHPYPAGAKSYSKTKPIRIEEFAPERAWWPNREPNTQAWRVGIEAIRANNFNLDVKNPRNLATAHGDPAALWAAYDAAATAAAHTRATLKAELLAAVLKAVDA